MPEFETDESHDYSITRLFIREGFYDNESSDSLDSSLDSSDTIQTKKDRYCRQGKETNRIDRK